MVASVAVPPELAGRLSIQGGDFFAAVPAGAAAYLLRHILHDWGDEACLRILGQIRAVMAAGARVLLVEQVIPPGNAPSPASCSTSTCWRTPRAAANGRPRSPPACSAKQG